MKKTIIIIGILAVTGGIAFLYLRNNKKTDKLLSSDTLGSTQTASTSTMAGITNQGVGSGSINVEIPPLSTGLIVTPTTAASSSQGQINLEKARQIELIIKDYIKKSQTRQFLISSWRPTSAFINSKGQIGKKPTNPFPPMISKLKDDLLKLGYEFKGGKDGVLVKL